MIIYPLSDDIVRYSLWQSTAVNVYRSIIMHMLLILPASFLRRALLPRDKAQFIARKILIMSMRYTMVALRQTDCC